MKPVRPDDSAEAVSEPQLRVLNTALTAASAEGGELDVVRAALESLGLALGATAGVAVLRRAGGDDYVRWGVEAHPPGALDGFARQALGAGTSDVRSTPRGWEAAPLLHFHDVRLGALAFGGPPEGAPPSPALIDLLGRQLGSVLGLRRQHAELRAAAAQAEVLQRLTSTLTADLDVKRAVAALARELSELLEFHRLVCGFVNDAGGYLEIIGEPEGESWGLGPVLPLVGSGPGQVLQDGQPLMQSDLVHQHRFLEDMRLLDEGIRSYVVLPLTARGRRMGVLALGSHRTGSFDAASLERLAPLADAAALALDNVRLLQKTRELSISDEVTPLFNFRFFHQILDRELKLVDRYQSVLSLIFMDLDRFKAINDKHGHLRGSRVLREVGFLMRSAVRETDYPVRYGGDEFVVVLPQTDGGAARRLGEKLRAIIVEHTFLQEEGINARLGLSLGIATYPSEASTKEGLIRLADERMYADKERREEGR